MEAASVTAAGHEALVASGPLNRLRSDRRLVDRYRDGDEGAFGALYERYHARVEAICLGVLGSRHDAQDAAQETFASAAQQLRSERPPLELKAWLGRVARNAAIDVARRRRATSQLPDDAPAPNAEPVGRLQRRADLDALVSALQTLPERQRSALVLRELGGLSYAEIGAALKSDEPVVRGLISRARMGLRHELEAGDLACARVREHLADEIDGRRRPTEIRRHLRGCSDCRSFGVGRCGRWRRGGLGHSGCFPVVVGLLQGGDGSV